MSYVIYSISDPRDVSVFYIGQTMDFEQRKKSHTNSCHNSEMRLFIEEIINAGGRPLFSVLEHCTLETASILEDKWIKHYESLGYNLFNKPSGRRSIEKDPKAKQMNVMVSGATQDNETFKLRTKYMSFSAYVNSLIDNDLNGARL